MTELTEWQEDLWREHTGSRIVLVKLPTGWGRTAVLDRFSAQVAAREDAPVTIPIRVDGRDLPRETSLQAQALRDRLLPAVERHRAAELLGLDRVAGVTQLVLGAGSLAFSGLDILVPFLMAQLAVGAAGKVWDESPAGQDGALARAARAVAAVSVAVPVVVIVDDADVLDHDLAVTLIENLAARRGGQVLIIAAVNPSSRLAAALTDRSRFGITEGLVYAAEVNPDMGYESRLALAGALRPNLPGAAVRQIARRTATFGEVCTVAAAPGLGELSQDADEGDLLVVVNTAVNMRLARPAPSAEAVVIAWAGGLVHSRQAEQALNILGVTRQEDDPDVRQQGSLERLADLAAPRLGDHDQVTVGLASTDRRAMAAAFLRESLALTANPLAGLVDQTAALLAAHRVRDDVVSRSELLHAQRKLVAALEALGDHAAALDVAASALNELTPGAGRPDDKDALAAAVLRLSHIAPQPAFMPLAEKLIADAIADGAITGLEARVWAAADLLKIPGQRKTAFDLIGKIAADLDARPNLGEAGDRWRLLLAYRLSRTGQHSMVKQLLGPLLASADPARHRAALAILDAEDGPRADIRLQNIFLNEELAALPAHAEDDRLRVHHALAANYATLGEYHLALAHAEQELSLRIRIQRLNQPDTLAVRARIAIFTGRCGNAAGSVSLLQELLPDQVRVLGADHRATLATRNNIAYWTGQCGDAVRMLALYQDLEPDQRRVLGPSDLGTLTTRNNIATWTAYLGDVATGLDLLRDLLPDQERVLGPSHPQTLTIRGNIASLTARRGDVAAALDLLRDLLPDQERVLGPCHPDTMITRGNIAGWTAELGDVATALDLARDLLADQEQTLGPAHPDTLATRGYISLLISGSGEAARP